MPELHLTEVPCRKSCSASRPHQLANQTRRCKDKSLPASSPPLKPTHPLSPIFAQPTSKRQTWSSAGLMMCHSWALAFAKPYFGHCVQQAMPFRWENENSSHQGQRQPVFSSLGTILASKSSFWNHSRFDWPFSANSQIKGLARMIPGKSWLARSWSWANPLSPSDPATSAYNKYNGRFEQQKPMLLLLYGGQYLLIMTSRQACNEQASRGNRQ